MEVTSRVSPEISQITQISKQSCTTPTFITAKDGGMGSSHTTIPNHTKPYCPGHAAELSTCKCHLIYTTHLPLALSPLPPPTVSHPLFLFLLSLPVPFTLHHSLFSNYLLCTFSPLLFFSLPVLLSSRSLLLPF
jgi:hypothetical protein